VPQILAKGAKTHGKAFVESMPLAKPPGIAHASKQFLPEIFCRALGKGLVIFFVHLAE
jgi:hypothetical protein